MLVSDKDIEAALQILQDEEAAAARAAHEFFDEQTKVVLAEIMGRPNEGSQAERQRWALTQTEYLDHLKKVGKFAREDYAWRQRIAAANAKIELYRTISANSRRLDKL